MGDVSAAEQRQGTSDPFERSQLLARAVGFGDDLVKVRRAVHRRPELGFEEKETAALVAAHAKRWMPHATTRAIAETGVLVELGEGPGTVMLRGCLDALPVQEAGGLPFASETPGISHACGHDGQVAVLLGALRLLVDDPPPIRVVGLFQPAEELDTGARACLADGLLDGLEAAMILGFHGHPALDAGTVSVQAGPVMASITTLRCEISGREGHGAEPHLATDAATAAASLVLDWQVALARRVDPRDAVVLSIGRIEAGVTPNVIPGRALVEGTLRSLDPASEGPLTQILQEVARAVEIRTGTTVRLRAETVVPAVVNDPAATEVARRGAEVVVGTDDLVKADPTLGGDDFAWLQREVPGCYLMIGERRQDRPAYGWHDPSYDLDERSLPVGAAVLAAAVHEAARGGLR